MRRSARLWLSCLPLLLGLLCPIPISAQSGKPELTPEQQAWIKAHPVVRYTIEGGWRPLIDIENGRPVGLLPQYLAHFAKTTGLRLEFVPSTDWRDALNKLNTGEVDMLPGITRYHQRAFASPPLLTRTFVSGSLIIIGRADESVAFSMNDLAGKRVAIHVKELAMVPTEQMGRMRIVPVQSVEQALEAVATERADYLIGLEAIHPAFVRSRYIGKLGVAGTLDVTPLEAKIAVRPGGEQLQGILNWAISQLTTEQTDVLFEEAASQIQYGAPSLPALWRYRRTELLILALLLTGLAAAVVVSLRARRHARNSEQAKARFLAMMSHEIRTPINVIVGSLEALERQRLQGPPQRIVDTMTLAADTLTDLLDNVLDLSKLEAGKVVVQRVAADPAELLRNVARLMVIRAEAKGLDLYLEVDELPTGMLELDITRLRQVLVNLAGNAIKFTERGHITLRARQEHVDGCVWLRLDVCDTGVGIATVDQATLFRPYVQADNALAGQYRGTGLGLAICRELTHLMGGQIWLTSVQGKGTDVSLRIPWLSTNGDVSAPQGPLFTPAPSPLSHLQVLACDDNPLNLDVLRQQLESLGACVFTVDGGGRALAFLRERSVDLVLLDCNMPGMDGYETASRIREEIDSELPIFAVSAASDDAHLQRCLDVGMSAVLRKPTRTRELLGVLALWELAAPESVDTTSHSPADFKPEGLAPLPYLVDDLDALERAYATGDLDAASFHLHRIKGTAGLFGMTEIEAAAIELEKSALTQGAMHDSAALASLIRRREA
jgi:signal transduction histidine kinase/ActR/RegA family two-component response regulator